MRGEAHIDVELLKIEIKKMYAAVSQAPDNEFIFPTGRAWAEDLDYPDELARVPETAAESFAGVANPFALGRLETGEDVLDIGCGAGTDTFVAAERMFERSPPAQIDLLTSAAMTSLQLIERRQSPGSDQAVTSRRAKTVPATAAARVT